MSERETNERRKIKRGSISGLADTTMKVAASQDGQGPALEQDGPSTGRRSQEGRGPEEPETTVSQQADASQEGRGPEEPETKATVPQQADASQEGQGPEELETKATVPQQADASQEGQGPEEPETKAAVPQQADASQEGRGPEEPETKATVPQQADASQEGRGPEKPEPKAAVSQQADASQEGRGPAELEEDTDSDRVRKLVTLLKDAIDSDGQSDKQIDVLARNLAEQKRVLLRKAATRIAEVEAKTEVAVDQFTDEIVGFLESLTQTLKEGNAQKSLERARKTQDDIVRRYWDRFVGGFHGMYQAKLDETKRKIQVTLNATTDDFSRQIAALFQKSLRQIQSPVVPFRQRIFRERRLLAGTLVLGLLLGSFLGTLGETLWNRAGLTGRQDAPGVHSPSSRTPLRPDSTMTAHKEASHATTDPCCNDEGRI